MYAEKYGLTLHERLFETQTDIFSGFGRSMFAYPIITPVNVGKRLDVNYMTASRYLAALAKGKVLQESYVGKYHLFINKPLLDLLKG